MSKFKVGDVVIPQKFKSRDGYFFTTEMKDRIGVPQFIDGITESGFYRIGRFSWPEEALMLASMKDYLKQFASSDDELKNNFKKQTEKPLQTVITEPARKTFGDFMLAALTGLTSRNAVDFEALCDPIVGRSYLRRMAEASFNVAKAAFELYEKEGRP